MVNYTCAFNQSEMEKYFEWIIKIIITYSAMYIGVTWKHKHQNL